MRLREAESTRLIERYLHESGQAFTDKKTSGEIYVTTVQRTGVWPYTLPAIELGFEAACSTDHRDDIDHRMAKACYETTTFADYIGAPWDYSR